MSTVESLGPAPGSEFEFRTPNMGPTAAPIGPVGPSWIVYALALAFIYVALAILRWGWQYLRARLGGIKDQVVQLFADTRKPVKRPRLAPTVTEERSASPRRRYG